MRQAIGAARLLRVRVISPGLGLLSILYTVQSRRHDIVSSDPNHTLHFDLVRFPLFHIPKADCSTARRSFPKLDFNLTVSANGRENTSQYDYFQACLLDWLRRSLKVPSNLRVHKLGTGLFCFAFFFATRYPETTKKSFGLYYSEKYL